MNGFVEITDNDWCAYVILFKQDWPNAQGLRRKAIIHDVFNNTLKTTFNKPMYKGIL